MNVRANNTTLNLFKKTIKRCIQHLAASFGRHTRNSKEPQLLVLMYHRIMPQDDPRSQLEEPGMIVSPDTFELHLKLLKQHFTIVNLSDWVQIQQDGGELPPNACAITFDDGWVDNFEYAYPILKKFKAPATIFLVSDMIGTNEMFWPERLARLIVSISSKYPQHWSHPELAWLQSNLKNYQFSHTQPTREEISALIADAKDFTDYDIHERITQIENLLQLDKSIPAASLLNWQQIAEMVDSGLIDLGSHTRHHVRLNSNASEETLKDEIVGSKQTIEKHTGKSVKTFCFPNGDFCTQALQLVKDNYLCAVSTQSGWNTTSADKYLIKRIGIHQDISSDETSFLARLSGWM
jgi:peptidoglycan/xylan/chitin deacetylase (PgdA/CDA1 family)